MIGKCNQRRSNIAFSQHVSVAVGQVRPTKLVLSKISKQTLCLSTGHFQKNKRLVNE